MDNEKVEFKYDEIVVDMSVFISDEAKALRSKISACQRQMDYLAFKYNLFLKEQEKYRSEYHKLIGVEENGKPVQ